MSARVVALLVLCTLLLAGVVWVRADGGLRPVVQPGTATGGNYRLTGLGEGGAIVASGGHYRLQGGVQPMLTGSGCCCIFIPCLVWGIE